MAFDWTVLGLGVAVFIGILGVVAILFASRAAPGRTASRSRPGQRRTSQLARVAAAAPLPIAAAAGVNFALEADPNSQAVPMRSAVFGAAVAITVVVATLTFGASLNTLVSHPALYGWNWNAALDDGINDIPGPQATQFLDADHDIAAWTGFYFDSLAIDGQTIPVLGTDPDAAVAPPVLFGHGLQAANQIVLGGVTLANSTSTSATPSWWTPAPPA